MGASLREDEPDIPGGSDILKRIPPHDHEIGDLARLNLQPRSLPLNFARILAQIQIHVVTPTT